MRPLVSIVVVIAAFNMVDGERRQSAALGAFAAKLKDKPVVRSPRPFTLPFAHVIAELFCNRELW